MAIEEAPFTLRQSGPRDPYQRGTAGSARQQVSVTVSIGVAESFGPRAEPAEVIRAADQAMYRAKDGRRNRAATESRGLM